MSEPERKETEDYYEGLSDRERAARDIVDRWVRWSFGAGLIPAPIVDLAALTAIQLKMLNDLADHYEVPFSENRGKMLIGALLGGTLPTKLAWGSVRSAFKAVPFVGPILGFMTMPSFGATSTQAIGRVFVRHFEEGGTLLDFEPGDVKDYVAHQVEEGKRTLSRSERRARREAALAKRREETAPKSRPARSHPRHEPTT
ncbi:MAG TPA: DUF697 domain-containing protein [Thermoanaerobaculia bacterium]|jgi:uncharacterized protein (DUF697 family)|nr:DUF697 domain-containing protein [Thermoanaerobaculia bacterium]